MSVGRHTAVTDPGRKRRRNEDAYVLHPPLFAVADGMGGAKAGEIASRIAAAVLESFTGGAGGERRVEGLIREANRRVYERSAEDESVSGMGTTMTVALVESSVVHVGHVGDSRAYLVRDGRLDQLTEDHSLVAELVRSGKLSPEEADTHPQRSMITRVLGTEPDVDVDTFSIQARTGDVFLLCSDGLTTMVDDETILRTLERDRGDLQKAAKALVDAANKGGGEDNITIVLFEIDAEGEETATIVPPARGEAETLDELDHVPTVDAETVGDRRTQPRVSRLVFGAGGIALVLVLAALVVWGLSRSYFVGATADGRVAVYQGFPWDLVGGVRLYRLRYESRLLAAQLSQEERKTLFDHDLVSYDSALREVKRFESEVVP